MRRRPWDTEKTGNPFHDDPFFNPWQRGGAFNHPEPRAPRRNPEVDAYAEKMVRDEWMRKMREHGDSKCSECGHSGWTHSPRGCCAYINPPMKMTDIGGMQMECIDGSLTWEELSTYKCKCHAHEMCKSNEQIIFGRNLPEVQNEPLDKSLYE